MSKVNYGMPLRDTGLPEGMIKYIVKDLGPLEKAAIINTLLNDLISGGCKFIDGDNPGDDFLSEMTYDPDTDNLIFWTENL